MNKTPYEVDTSLSDLITDCLSALSENFLVIEENEPNRKMGYIWCVPAQQTIHFVQTAIGNWYEAETHDCTCQTFFDCQQIIKLIEENSSRTLLKIERPVLFAVFSVLHEIGHCVDCRNDQKDFESRADERTIAFDSMCSLARAQAAEYKGPAEVFSEYAAKYRRLPCEREADQFALVNMEKVLS